MGPDLECLPHPTAMVLSSPSSCPWPPPHPSALGTLPRQGQLSPATPLSALTPCSRNPAELLPPPPPHSHEGPQEPNPALVGTSLVPPWLHTGVFSPLPAAFQAVLLLTRKAPNTFPSHGGVVGPPSQEALIFQIGKKKWDAGRRGQGGGCIFLVFFLGPDSSSSARQMEKGSQSTPCVPGQAPAAGLAATGANWGSFLLVQREWRGPRRPQLEREHPACCRRGGLGTGVLRFGSA